MEKKLHLILKYDTAKIKNNIMNEWQKGYDLELLKALAKPIKQEYKNYVYGAFGIPNERDIATYLEKGEVIKTKENDSLLIWKQYQKKGAFSDFTGETIDIDRGTFYIKHLAGPNKKRLLEYFLEQASNKPTLIEIFEEDIAVRDLINSFGFNFITTKIAASSDLKSIYEINTKVDYKLKEGESLFVKEVERTFLSDEELSAVREELTDYSNWASHYSSYNKRNSWSAFALRGYKEDHNFIIKPAEMSQKWKKENEELLKHKSDWTDIAQRFPKTLSIVQNRFFGSTPDRVRFMKLNGGKGELSRHADITDREAGIQTGKVVRLHIPIRTNENVLFNLWNHRGEKKTEHLKEGSLWYLDVRKPHTAANNGSEDRIHLVMDFYVSEDLKNYIINQ